jgi:hypothetical protein
MRVSNDNGVRAINFAASENLIVRSTTFPHHNSHKHTWTSWPSPDGVTHNQVGHVLRDKRQYSCILDVRSFRGADCVMPGSSKIRRENFSK